MGGPLDRRGSGPSTSSAPEVCFGARTARRTGADRAETGASEAQFSRGIAATRSTQERKRARNHPWTPRTGQQDTIATPLPPDWPDGLA